MSMVIMAQTAANWHNTHSHVDRTHSLTSYQHSYNTVFRSASSANYILWNRVVILKVREGGGANRSTRRKPPDILPANRYHILEEKM